ncbi:MAG: phosphoglycerate kinase [Patescibacteria group bacterium]
MKFLCTMDNIAWRSGMRVLIRIDADVAMKGGRISEDFRIKQALPTIRAALRHKAHIRIISHRGRPKGVPFASLTQKPISLYLSRLLKKKILFIKDPFGKTAFSAFNESSDILFFENIRFWKGEEENNASFAHELARWGDIYINDAFANCHREHVSVLGITHELLSYAGMNLEKEVAVLGRVLTNPEHPFVAILGGAKLETKVPLIKKFLVLADHVLIGGAIANTLIAALGYNVGKSLVDEKKESAAKFLLNKKLHIPSDVVVTKNLSGSSSMRVCAIHDVAPDEYIVDIGPATLKHFSSLLAASGMVVWNGPAGFAEVSDFARGTIHLARAVAHAPAFKIIGGGDTIALLRTYHALRGFTYVSTGGGAMLEFLSGKKLSSIEALRK